MDYRAIEYVLLGGLINLNSGAIMVSLDLIIII